MNPTDTSGGTTTGEDHTTLLPVCEVPPIIIKNSRNDRKKSFSYEGTRSQQGE